MYLQRPAVDNVQPTTSVSAHSLSAVSAEDSLRLEEVSSLSFGETVPEIKACHSLLPHSNGNVHFAPLPGVAGIARPGCVCQVNK